MAAGYHTGQGGYWDIIEFFKIEKCREGEGSFRTKHWEDPTKENKVQPTEGKCLVLRGSGGEWRCVGWVMLNPAEH